MPKLEEIFKLRAKRTRWFTGYSAHLNPLIEEVREDFCRILVESTFLKNAPFRSLSLFLQFSNREEGPKIHFIDRKESRLTIEASIDWRDHAADDRLTLKWFFLESVVRCIFWVAAEYSFPWPDIKRVLLLHNVPVPSDTMGGGPIEESIFEYHNELEIAVKLSDDNFGTEKEIEACHALIVELEELGADEDGTLAGGGFYKMYFRSDQPNQLYRDIAPFLKRKRLRRGSYAEAQYLSGIYLEHDRFDL